MKSKLRIRFADPIHRKMTRAAAASVFIVLAAWFVPRSLAQQHNQRTFRSAEDASLALFTAAQQENDSALLDILGPGGKDLISSGDPTEDANERTGFVVKYQQMHRLAAAPDGTTTLYVGAENWPFPIPLVNQNGNWFFDTDAGKQEVLVRRIGDNELAAIDALRALVDAEKVYYKNPFDGRPHYAQRFISDRGKHNGLYWSEAADEFDSAIDPLIASAGQEKTSTTSAGDLATSDPIPFKGYYFRILTRQGQNASGGAKTYLVDGNMLHGFAFIAYPAEYRSSGVMTFIVNDDGVVYDKDLGANTAQLASAMTEYNPDSTWRQAD